MISKLSRLNFQQKGLAAVIFLAFIIRITGISYGLPLWLVDDEPPFVLAAIKMIQLHTLIPALHQAEFAKILYYPPYLSYIYVAPFAGILSFQYLSHYSLGEFFVPFIVSDLSLFYMMARFIMVIASLISIFLIYRVGRNLFSNERIGLVAAALLSTSLLHVMLSVTSRHWLAVSFFGLLIFSILTDSKYGNNRKYLLASIAAGIGMGFSVIVSAYLALIALWYLLAEKYPVSKANIFSCIVSFVALSAIPLLLYPQSLGFTGDVSARAAKTLSGIIASPFLFLSPIASSEPILIALSLIGLAALLFYRKNLFLIFFFVIYSYSALFYLAFRYEHRFTAGLLPFLALLAAYGLNHIYELTKTKWIFSVLIVPLIFSAQLSRLILHDDSRINAKTWIEQNIPAHEKILVYARLTRLPSEPDSINEQKMIDSGSLRKVDEAEAVLPADLRAAPAFRALNLYSVNNDRFFTDIAEYAAKNNYRYALISDENFMRGEEEFAIMQKLGRSGKLIKTFGSHQSQFSISMTQLIGNPLGLFRFGEFGPPLSLYGISR